MGDEALRIGAESRPRYEFRSFGQDFARVHQRMARLSVPLPEEVWERRSSEIYVVSGACDHVNAKIRDGKLDIKTHVRTVEGLEQWAPLMKGAFPLSPAMLGDDVLPALGAARHALPSDDCDEGAFLDLIRTYTDLHVVRVAKQRFGYMVNDTICEYAVVLINGARVVTVSSESTSIEAVQRTVEETAMSGLENINYLQAIKRVLGLIAKPLSNEWPAE